MKSRNHHFSIGAGDQLAAFAHKSKVGTEERFRRSRTEAKRLVQGVRFPILPAATVDRRTRNQLDTPTGLLSSGRSRNLASQIHCGIRPTTAFVVRMCE